MEKTLYTLVIRCEHDEEPERHYFATEQETLDVAKKRYKNFADDSTLEEFAIHKAVMDDLTDEEFEGGDYLIEEYEGWPLYDFIEEVQRCE